MKGRYSIIFIVLLLPLSLLANSLSLPGRKENSEIYMAKFGEMRVFFFMTPEKHKLATDFIHEINNNIALTTFSSEIEFPTYEVTPVFSKFPEPVGSDKNHEFICDDIKGRKIFLEHSQKVKEIAEKALNIQICGGLSSDMSLIMNFDSNKFHQDQFKAQYSFLENYSAPIPEYYLVQDLTLIDWGMAQGTISGTMIQDAESEDRFILPLFSNEVVGNFYVEPALYVNADTPPEYPGAKTLLPHSPFSPIDFDSDMTPGSAKGKRISVVVRGVSLKEDIEKLENASYRLPVSRPLVTSSPSESITSTYPDGITLKDLPTTHRSLDMSYGTPLTDLKNTEVFQTDPRRNKESIQEVQKLFNIHSPLKKVLVKHLIKKDGGFCRLSLKDLAIPKNSIIILLNDSSLPEGYRYYNVAEDSGKKGLPWIHLYHFPSHKAVLIPSEKFDDLLLTPIEEIMFRDADQDTKCKEPNVFNKKIVTKIDLLIFPPL